MKRLFLAAALAASAAPAAAETVNCTNITSLPATITAPGVYCLKQDLATSITSGNAITINANSVTIDFNGYKLGGLGAGPATDARGVFAQDRKNITLRNGNIRGFVVGIFLREETGGSSSGHVIENNLLEANTGVGISASGSGIVVRGNRVVNTDSTPPPSAVLGKSVGAGVTSLSPVATARPTPGAFGGVAPMAGTGGAVNGINGTVLRNSAIVDNFVSGTISSGSESYGIFLSGASNVVVARNTVLDTRGASYTNGVLSFGSNGPVVVEDNVFTLGSAQSHTAIGIEALDGTFLCRNNTVNGFANGQTSGCTAQEGLFPVVP